VRIIDLCVEKLKRQEKYDVTIQRGLWHFFVLCRCGRREKNNQVAAARKKAGLFSSFFEMLL